MRKKKLQVFISSTFNDLKEERQAAVEAILTAGHIPAGMELFAAGDETQMEVIRKWIDESDVYLLLLGGRYGSIEPKSGKSYTHLEYEYAYKIGKALFAVVINEEYLKQRVKSLGIEIIETDNPKELKIFRSLVTSKLIKFWSDIKDIKLAVIQTLSDFNERDSLTGWIKSNELVESEYLKDSNISFDFFKHFLNSTLSTFVGIYDVTEEMHIDEIGNCTFTRWNMLVPQSEYVSHTMFTFTVDKPGKINILEVTDIDSGNELRYLYSSTKGTYHKVIILFDSPIELLLIDNQHVVSTPPDRNLIKPFHKLLLKSTKSSNLSFIRILFFIRSMNCLFKPEMLCSTTTR